MAGMFDVFITVDSNMRYQQAVEQAAVGFVVLSAHNNKLETLRPLMSRVRESLETIQPGQVVIISEKDEA